MKFLFTGATSLAGRRLYTHLCGMGHEVWPVSRRPQPGRNHAVLADMEQSNFVDQLPDEHFDVLLNFASFVPFVEKSSAWSECYTKNVLGLTELLKWAAGRVDKVVHASSCAVYGPSSSALPRNEASPVNPNTAYAVSKYAQEQLLMAYCFPHNIPLVILRLGFVYGPDLSADRSLIKLIDRVQNKLPVTLENGRSCGLPLIHQDDIARLAAELIADGEGVYNLASHQHISLMQYVDEVMYVLDKQTEVFCHQEPGLPFANHYPCDALVEKHGLHPTVSLQEGIRSMMSGRGGAYE